MRTSISLLLLLVSLSARSEKVELNKILFTSAQQSWTLRDMQVYDAVLSEVFKKKRISQFSQNEYGDFMLSRLTQKEADSLSISADAIELTDAVKKKLVAFDSSEVTRELKMVAQAQAFIEIKEAQHKDATRFNNWFELLKRKYSVKIKSAPDTK